MEETKTMQETPKTTIAIASDVHYRVKVFAAMHRQNLAEVVQTAIIEYLDAHTREAQDAAR
jgi:hypothetical protein